MKVCSWPIQSVLADNRNSASFSLTMSLVQTDPAFLLCILSPGGRCQQLGWLSDRLLLADSTHSRWAEGMSATAAKRAPALSADDQQ